MKRKAVVMGAAVAGILSACGHDHSGGSPPVTPPPASTNVNVTTSELLTGYAEKPSETAPPILVNGSMFTISDTSETTNPITVNGN
ncbi:MAG TPA: hypothetical protein VH209_10455 [Steroidobacteraceae bacterium]|nr:hypothetical protein [Steroidobacteraceae bacterium]